MFRNFKLKIKDILSNYWISIVTILILCVLFVLWFIYWLPYSDLDSARWALSALVQCVAAVFGLIIVAITLSWSQATSAESNLRRVRDKYLWILINMDVQQRGGLGEGTIIEQLRKDYFSKIKSKYRAGGAFPFKHRRYKSDKDLFLEISSLSELVDSFLHKGKRSNKELIDADLQQLGWAEEGDLCYLRSLDLMGQAVTFFEVLYDIFAPVNLVFYELRYGWDLPDAIRNQFLNDNIESDIKRIRTFRRFKGTLVKITILPFILTLVVGLLFLSSLSYSNFHLYMLVYPIILGLLSIALLTITLNMLLHSD